MNIADEREYTRIAQLFLEQSRLVDLRNHNLSRKCNNPLSR